MNEKFVIITTSGDPWDNNTWSGVPVQLTKAFQNKGILLAAFNGDFPLPIRFALLKFANFFFNITKSSLIAPQIHREPYIYRVRQYILSKKLKNFPKNSVLLSIGPLTVPNESIPYFLYIDSILPQWIGKGYWCWNEQDENKKICERLINQEKKILNNAYHIFTLSEWARKGIIQEYNIPESKITAVGTGCITPLWYCNHIGDLLQQKLYDKKKLLFVGKDFKRKGGYLLLEAFKIAKQKIFDLTLDIVGCDVKIRENGINVHGKVSWQKLQRLYLEASLFVMPSYLEPWGMVFMEAGIAGLPSIGLNRCATPEVIINGVTGRLVEPHPKILSNVIVEMIQQPHLLKEMGKNARNFVLNHFTWEKVVLKMLPKLIEAKNKLI